MNHDVLVLNRDFMPTRMWPLSTVPWHRAIRGIVVGSLQVIHNYEDRLVRSPSTVMAVPSIVMLSRYVRPKFSVAFTDRGVFLRDRYTCQYCMKRFPESQLTFDHVLPESHGGKTDWTNIVAACGPCNWGKGNDRRIKPKVMPYKPSYYELVERAKEFTLTVPDPAWVDYLQWPQEKILVKPIKRNNKLPIEQEV